MMKGKKRLFIFLAVLSAAVIGGAVWWKMPVRFLARTDSRKVECIEVMDGNTGNSFVITESEDIAYIVNNIQETVMKRWKPSLGYMGWRFSMKFLDQNGRTTDEFILNSQDTIRKDPFFYNSGEGRLCYDYLSQLEEQ